MQLIEPDTASTAMAAFANASRVKIWRGRRSSSTMATMRAPAARANANMRSEFASTGALPGSAMPSASHTICMELAVPMPEQTPGPRMAFSLMPRSSSKPILPAT